MRLSIVIPTWREEQCIAQSVRSACKHAEEVIVADSMSPDATRERALEAGARVVIAPRGRGPQLNAGARASTGDVVLFLHADTTLPYRARESIERALRVREVVGGNFRLRFVPRHPIAEIYSLANHLRRKHLRIYYGDSAIFVRRGVWDELAGFKDIPLFEDHEFVARLEALGRTAYITECEVETSSRRFAHQPIRTLALWAGLQTAYTLGVSPDRLARWYRDIR